MRIDEQSRTSVTYFGLVLVLVTDSATGSQSQIPLPRKDVTLEAGQSVTYTITL